VRVCIHRGSNQIGGSCVELEYEGARLLLDIGLPLGSDSVTPDLLPSAAGLATHDPALLGVVISHPHQDHWGLAPLLPEGTPFFMGAAAERILGAAAPFVPNGCALRTCRHLVDREPLRISPYTVTPHLIDHSAYDAYALLVEAGGKRLFYSGDLRAHGRKAALFERLVSYPPRGVDVMLMEGSTIGRLDADRRFPTEDDIERALADLIRATPGAVLVHASAQNIDRVVSIFRAAIRTGRVVVIDLYAAAILEATGNGNIPQSHWSHSRLLVPQWQRVHIKRAKMFDTLDRHSSRRIFPEHLQELASKAIFLFRGSMAADLERAKCLQGARLVWSQWDGYLQHPSFAGMLAWRERLGLPMDVLHTSGHACIADLQRLASAVGAKRLVPIHSFQPGRYAEYFNNVECRGDGERWEL
jgi:ribonuclease J